MMFTDRGGVYKRNAGGVTSIERTKASGAPISNMKQDN
jgi:hypothetical protein